MKMINFDLNQKLKQKLHLKQRFIGFEAKLVLDLDKQ